MREHEPMILVTGASGAIGSRLVEALVAGGERPIVAGRSPDRLTRRWPELRAVELDVLRPDTLAPGLEGIDTAYYLVHSMEPGAEGFAERDRQGASAFADAARKAGVARTVYLGGLGDEGHDLSEHLDSRHEIGGILGRIGPPTVEFRAAMVIGRESASFRMLTDLVNRLPLMIVPRWVDTPSQPIGVRDVVAYLVAAREVPLSVQHSIVEIGGADVLSYRRMMEIYAAARRVNRVILGVPLLTPGLSSLWCAVTTSVNRDVARPLVDGMTHPMLVRDDAAKRLFPHIRPVGFEEALRQALEGE
jgi:uncharacterized protein YbjT (DUF2867 family)